MNESSDEKDQQPTFDGFHDEMPESERAVRKPHPLRRKYGQGTKSEDELADERFWENAMRHGESDYNRRPR